MKSIKLGLCVGRHNINGIDTYIYPIELNPLDVKGMEQMAIEAISKYDAVDLYVTGLSVALVAVINAAHITGTALTLYHYDRDAGTYYPQSVAMGTRCPYSEDGAARYGC